MCGGPSQAEKDAAKAQRIAAEAEAARVANETAMKKRDDIAAALQSRTVNATGSSGAGRRSLFQSSAGGSGFLGRFG